jgi:hypothetical protein
MIMIITIVTGLVSSKLHYGSKQNPVWFQTKQPFFQLAMVLAIFPP